MAQLSNYASGRGVVKAAETPAMRDGLRPTNPEFFGVQGKRPIPYQKILANGNNLVATLRGFSQISGEDPYN